MNRFPSGGVPQRAIAATAAIADRVLMDEIIGRHQWMIYRVCMRLLGHHQDAEDMTQETLARAAKYVHRFDPRRPLEPWLVTIAGNRCRTLKARRAASASPPTRSMSTIGEVSSDHHRLDLEAAGLLEELQLAVASLPTNQRIAFELFHTQGLSYEQIAAEMKRPAGTIKTWVHRARRAMISQLRQREVVSRDGLDRDASDADADRRVR